MSSNASFSLGDHFSEFVDRQVELGHYTSAGDVIRAGLRLLEEEEVLKALRVALIEGEKGGPSTPFDVETFLARKRADLPPE